MKTSKTGADILSILQNAARPLCYDDFNLNVDKTTFYRNIAKFESENLICKLESDERKWYFELCTKPHAHFVCVKCKQIECIKDLNIELAGYEVKNITLKGVCRACVLGVV